MGCVPENLKKEFKANKRWKIGVRAGVGLIILVLLIRYVQADILIQSVNRLIMPYFYLALFLLYASIILGCLNQYFLFRPFMDVSVKDFFSAYFKAFATGLLMPGQLGDASIVFFLHSKRLHYSRTFSIYMWDKYITLVFYLGIVIFFLADILDYSRWLPIGVVVLLGILFIPLLLVISKWKCSEKATGWIERTVKFFRNSAVEVVSYAMLHPLRLVVNGGLTCLKLFIVMFCYYAIMASLGYDLPVFRVGMSCMASSIVSYLPISLHGVGTVEATAIWVLSRLKIKPVDVLSGFLLLRVGVYALAIIVFGLIIGMERKDIFQKEA